MKRFLLALFALQCAPAAQAQYNNLWIPDTLSGTSFKLTMKDTFTQILPGNQTITGGINGRFWGPTLIMKRGDIVQMEVTNKLNDSTTLHWHGMHLPAVMDGGPHQVIPPNTVWKPFWRVTDNATTLWYHPHLHEMTASQVARGLGGFIIIRDDVEAAMALPRTYGVDDIPLVIGDRKFDTANQIVVQGLGDTVMTNFTLSAQKVMPAQVVRYRMLNASIQRSYYVGFSDNRDFYVIGSDDGLLSAPVAKKRMMLSPGERMEILVNLTGQQGQAVDMIAYNSEMPSIFAGGQVPMPRTPTTNALSGRNFPLLHIMVGSPTANGVSTVPAALRPVYRLDTAQAQATRIVTFSDSLINGSIKGFKINNKYYDPNRNEYQIPLSNTEIWELHSTSAVSHPFHLHDVGFNIVSIDGQAPPPEYAGWKDVVMVPAAPRDTAGVMIRPTIIRFICRFDDYADSLFPFMYHCHILTHEDLGMMGQFIVVDRPAGVAQVAAESFTFKLAPNPAQDRIFLNADLQQEVYYVWITDAAGRTKFMLPEPDWKAGFDISTLRPGLYYFTLLDKKTGKKATQSFLKQ